MDTSLAELVTRAFKPEQLSRRPVPAPIRGRIPEASVDFIERVGLPKSASMGMEFLTAPEIVTRTFEGCDYCVVNQDWDSFIGIKLGLGTVHAVSAGHPREENLLINRNIESLAAFLAILRINTDINEPPKRWKTRTEWLDRQAEHANRCEQMMREIDPDAIAPDQLFWPVLVEQIRDGLF